MVILGIMLAIFYGYKKMYHEYLSQAKIMMVQGKERTDGYLVETNEWFMKEAKNLKKEKRLGDFCHPVFIRCD